MAARYLGCAAAADYLGFEGTDEAKAGALRTLVHRRQIDYIKWNGRLRFDIRALDTFMAKRVVRAIQETA